MNLFFNDSGLTSKGAQVLMEFLSDNPHQRHRIGLTTEVVHMGHSKSRTELRLDDLRTVLNLPRTISTGLQLRDLMPNVTTGFNDYGRNTVGLDLKKVALLAQGVNIAPGTGRNR